MHVFVYIYIYIYLFIYLFIIHVHDTTSAVWLHAVRKITFWSFCFVPPPTKQICIMECALPDVRNRSEVFSASAVYSQRAPNALQRKRGPGYGSQTSPASARAAAAGLADRALA